MRQLTSLLFLALIASIGEQATAKSATLVGSSIACQAQKAQTVHATGETNLYLAGAVPEVNGQVVFQQVYAVPGKTRDAIFNELKQYLDQVLKRPNALPASRITAAETEEGTLAATLHETLWFKRSAWVSDFATIICQLTFEVRDGGYTATLRNIRYQYDALTDAQQDNLLKAEDWITDKEALTKNGTKLTRVGGKKLRVKTIDLKTTLFAGAAAACGATQSSIVKQ